MAYIRNLTQDVKIHDTARAYTGYTLYAPMMERTSLRHVCGSNL